MTENNGNVAFTKPTSSSNEDLSEYTDADESISAPTEFLAEFLSAVMSKDYPTAQKYCKLILQYEPNNATAKEFYPLICEKLKRVNVPEDGSSNESEDEDSEANNSVSSSASESQSSSAEDSSEGQEEEEEEEEVGGGKGSHGKHSKGSSDGTTGSYSSLEDDEAVDQLAALAAKYQIDNVDFGNGNKIYTTAGLTTPKTFQEKLSNGNNATKHAPIFGTSSDSESPTEPVTLQTVAMLRARVVPSNS